MPPPPSRTPRSGTSAQPFPAGDRFDNFYRSYWRYELEKTLTGKDMTPGGFEWQVTSESQAAFAFAFSQFDPADCWTNLSDDPAPVHPRVDWDNAYLPWSLAKSASPGSGSIVAPGSIVTYTLTATNESTDTDPAHAAALTPHGAIEPIDPSGACEDCTTSNDTPPASPGASLPFTGFDVAGPLLAALLLLAAGAVLVAIRRRRIG